MEINLMQVQIHPTGAKVFTMLLDAIAAADYDELERVVDTCVDPVIERLARQEMELRLSHKKSKRGTKG